MTASRAPFLCGRCDNLINDLQARIREQHHERESLMFVIGQLQRRVRAGDRR